MEQEESSLNGSGRKDCHTWLGLDEGRLRDIVTRLGPRSILKRLCREGDLVEVNDTVAVMCYGVFIEVVKCFQMCRLLNVVILWLLPAK